MTQLLPYQLKGVRAINHFKGRMLLADEMGLGKTLQALQWVYENLEKRPVIIVCPSNAKYVWQEQAKLHLNMRTEVLEGRKPFKTQLPFHHNIFIFNFEILQYWIPFIEQLDPQVLIVDECHYIKSLSTKRTKAVKKLGKKIPNVLALSGTPILSRPAELYSTLNLIRPDLFPSFTRYAFRYCRPRRTHWGWDFRGASNLDELHGILKKTCMIRRLKKDVLQDLPPKTRKIVPLQIENRKEYDTAVFDFINWLSLISIQKAKRAKKAQELVKIGYLLRLAAELKMDAVRNWIDVFLQESDDKLVVFCHHKNIIQQLYKSYKKISVLVAGSVKGPDRTKAVKTFQNNKKIRLFFGNIKAAGVAITLTSSNVVAFVEMDFVPGNHTQAEDRVHRIGQTRKALIYYLIAKGTIEENLCKIIEKKQGVLDQVLDGKKSKNGINIHTQLLNELKGR